MTPEKYGKRVAKAALVVMAEEEGRLRGMAEVRTASADRVARESSGQDVTPDQRESADRDQVASRGMAAALHAEASEIRRRASLVGRWPGNVSAPEKPPERPRYTVEDVKLTLCKAGAGTSAESDARWLPLLRLLDLGDRASLSEAATIVRSLAWESGPPAGLASGALRVLEALAAEAPPDLPSGQR